MEMKKLHEACERKEEPLYRIGMFAQLNRKTIKTLRFYEDQGLLSPAYVDPDNGYRYYFLRQMAEIQQIDALKNAGFKLEDIRRLKNGADETLLLQNRKTQILSQIAELTKQLSLIDEYLLQKTSTLESPVVIKKIPECTVASMEMRIASYDALFDCMPKMGAEMERLSLTCAVPEYCFTNYLEPVYKEEDLLIETCQAITGKKRDSEFLKCKVMPGITAASIFHKGSYRDLAKSYAAVLNYIETRDLEICGPIRESYIDGVWNCEREEDWLSEIQIPVRKKGTMK